MIDPQKLHSQLQKKSIDFFTGVPDSLLKPFCNYITNALDESSHIIAANEGSAVAIAAGYHLATGKIGVVYMQNSGLGNAINPLISLVDSKVYQIPMILIIGWRGEPGKPDEPQHIRKGMITRELLKVLGIKYQIMPQEQKDLEKSIEKAAAYCKKEKKPFALLVRKNTFTELPLKKGGSKNPLLREEALEAILNLIDKKSAIISTTGKLSREVYEIRERKNQEHRTDFLTVGSMGHCSQIALGAAISSKKEIYCLDGDGAALMHMGGLATIGALKPKNLKHILFNNGVHESVGGHPTTNQEIDFTKIAKATGYKLVLSAKTKKQIEESIKKIQKSKVLSFLEIKIKPGARKDLGRPKLSPRETKRLFQKFLSKK